MSIELGINFQGMISNFKLTRKYSAWGLRPQG